MRKEVSLLEKGFKKVKKRGQITIFVIIAIIIVAIILLLFLFPEINIFIKELSAPTFIEECVKEELLPAKEVAFKQGGSINPENFILYQDEKLEYLCYTDKFYETCVMQQPLLMEHIETELEDVLRPVVASCVSSLKDEMESRGYSVETEHIDIDIEFVPNNINVDVLANVELIQDSRISYDNFKFSVNSKAYGLISIASSILNFEARYGDSDTTAYMTYYPNIKVEKNKQGDGSTIYILTDRTTGEQFKFASRSVAWPPGYGFDGV